MKGLTPGAAYACSFATGVDNPDPASVIVTVVRGGSVDGSFAVTVSRVVSGAYWLAGTVPTTYVAGDPVGVYVKYSNAGGSATVLNVDLFLVEDAVEYAARGGLAKIFNNVFPPA